MRRDFPIHPQLLQEYIASGIISFINGEWRFDEIDNSALDITEDLTRKDFPYSHNRTLFEHLADKAKLLHNLTFLE